MAENLSVIHYRNGDEIPHVQNPDEWAQLNTGAWCYFGIDSSNIFKYGILYNWYAVNDPRGLAPKKWHISTNEEWTILVDFLGSDEFAGKKMKSKSGWNGNGNGNNRSGFNCIPGGGRTINGDNFGNLGGNCGFWTSTEIPNKSKGHSSSSFSRNLDYYSSLVYTYKVSKMNGFYVRCIKR